MLGKTMKDVRVGFTCMVGVAGVLLGWNLAAAEWKYDSKGPSIESQFEMIKGKDGAPMIQIPQGEFVMGANDGSRNERPEHTVFLGSYYIDQFEVTMERYQVFLDETYHDLPPLWDDGAALEEAKDRPAVGMAWGSAKTYCEWAGKRLPTEAEWEKAARGTDGRRYPWGHMQPFVDIARYNLGTTGWVSYHTTLAPVTSGTEGMSIRHGLKHGTKSPYGLFHMAGNASEWVADWYGRTYYEDSPEKNPTGPTEGERKIYRGGSWEDAPKRLRVTSRASAEPDFPIEANDLTIGFRCVQNEKTEVVKDTKDLPKTEGVGSKNN
jgi:sulfatase modifying factor 1